MILMSDLITSKDESVVLCFWMIPLSHHSALLAVSQCEPSALSQDAVCLVCLCLSDEASKCCQWHTLSNSLSSVALSCTHEKWQNCVSEDLQSVSDGKLFHKLTSTVSEFLLDWWYVYVIMTSHVTLWGTLHQWRHRSVNTKLQPLTAVERGQRSSSRRQRGLESDQGGRSHRSFFLLLSLTVYFSAAPITVWWGVTSKIQAKLQFMPCWTHQMKPSGCLVKPKNRACKQIKCSSGSFSLGQKDEFVPLGDSFVCSDMNYPPILKQQYLSELLHLQLGYIVSEYRWWPATPLPHLLLFVPVKNNNVPVTRDKYGAPKGLVVHSRGTGDQQGARRCNLLVLYSEVIFTDHVSTSPDIVLPPDSDSRAQRHCVFRLSAIRPIMWTCSQDHLRGFLWS